MSYLEILSAIKVLGLVGFMVATISYAVYLILSGVISRIVKKVKADKIRKENEISR